MDARRTPYLPEAREIWRWARVLAHMEALTDVMGYGLASVVPYARDGRYAEVSARIETIISRLSAEDQTRVFERAQVILSGVEEATR